MTLLDRLLANPRPAFALLHRPEATGPSTVDVIAGETRMPRTLAEISLPAAGRARQDTLVLLPYRQITERGFACPDDGEPLVAIRINEHETADLTTILATLPNIPITAEGGCFDVPDQVYADLVRDVIADEIGRGEGANFVLRRTFVVDIPEFVPAHAFSLFRRLLERESSAYWTFLIHTGDRIFVGATPERHVSLRSGTAVMNPISGTYRYPPSGPTLPGLVDFLADRKETEELYMVLDEELKMMARICADGGRVIGPYLKEMARLAHTEYLIEGHSTDDPRDILRETMFAPTVTGSPLESACRVINRYEPHGRGYYSGVAALIGRDEQGAWSMDSAILIRTADIDRQGRLRIGVGATLVRHSDPMSEVAETRVKAEGLLSALRDERGLGDHPTVRAALAERNHGIARFWLSPHESRADPDEALAGRRVLVVDAEDTFTAMIGNQLRALGLRVTVRRFDEPYTVDDHDLVVLGPGPGDPRQTGHSKIAHLHHVVDDLLARQRPFLAVCLSHQVLCLRLGLELARRATPNQGVQREIDLFGVQQRVGFYNTFATRTDEDKLECPGLGVVEVSRDRTTGEVHALRGPFFASMQFHAESVLTQHGTHILADRLREALNAQA